jgi:hypothetical protein
VAAVVVVRALAAGVAAVFEQAASTPARGTAAAR